MRTERDMRLFWFLALLLGFTLAVITAAWTASSSPSLAAAPPVSAARVPVGGTGTPTPPDGNYTYSVSSGIIVPGTNLVPGSQCGGCAVPITLPFAFNFYGQDYTTANVTSQGDLQFNTTFLPDPVPTVCPFPDPRFGPAIFPHWSSWLGMGWHDSCQTYIGSACGIYTSTTGLAPNRIFNVEYRAQFISTSQHTAQFEIRLHEGTNLIDFLYGWVSYNGGAGSIGLQDGNTRYVQYACAVWGSVNSGLKITWIPPSSGPPTSTPTNTPVPSCTLPWSVVSSPSGGDYASLLYSVSAVSPGDIWAVGRAPDIPGDPFTIHWNGAQWAVVPAPTPIGSYYPTLRGVSALSTNDAWAVGYTSDFDNVNYLHTFTLHWNGSAWGLVSSPNPGGTATNYLSAVKALAPNDVWAVGYFSDPTSGGVRAFFLHWNGTAWTLVQGSDANGAGRRLFAVDSASSNDIWAAGDYDSHSAMFHWDGSTWSPVPVPDAGQLNGLSVRSATDAWAAGDGGTLHWNGSTWSFVPSPVLPLHAVQALSSSDVWAAGPGDQMAHWNGASWQAVPAARPGDLYSLTSASPTELWAVGQQMNQALTERALGSCGTVTPTATGQVTNTPTVTPTLTATPTRTVTSTYAPTGTATGTATATPIVATSTPTTTPTLTSTGTLPADTPTQTRTALATSTPVDTNTPIPTDVPTATASRTTCAVSFSDVSPADYFYEAVVYLYCHGAISGYSDGTFHPYNNATRGQLSKIVVLAEGWSIDTQGGPHFTDVPLSNPFYEYIETSYNRGVISGYADRTFRWGNNITRGQLCKIVVNAQEWVIDTSGGPHFTDMSPSDPFYGFVETAYNHQIVSGYADSTFRPGNNATRGQISKIVYNAVTGNR